MGDRATGHLPPGPAGTAPDGASGEGLSGEERAVAAANLRAAEREHRAIPRLTTTFPGMTVDDAYLIQLANVAWQVERGAKVGGHKVGLSSPAMQEMMGVDEPDYGHLLDTMLVTDRGEIPMGRLLQPRIEVEPAFILAAPLPAPGCNVEDVRRCTGWIVPSLEIIDSRIEHWSLTLRDTIADNASSGLVVLGSRRTPLDAVDLGDLEAFLRRNGTLVDTGNTKAILGDPLFAVAWLANKVHEFGVTLQAGQVVLPGSCMRAHDVVAGDRFQAEIASLGDVTVRFC